MHSDNSNDRLIGALEPVRELLRYVEMLQDVEESMPSLCEHLQEARLRLDREIEHLRQNGR
jgi:hypothetical protein